MSVIFQQMKLSQSQKVKKVNLALQRSQTGVNPQVTLTFTCLCQLFEKNHELTLTIRGSHIIRNTQSLN